jgi:hypothetical protein
MTTGVTTEAILSVAAKPEHRFDVTTAFGLMTTTETPPTGAPSCALDGKVT